jgi:hypothetical protein
VAPGNSIKVKEQEKMMRLDRVLIHWKWHLEKLRRKWLDFSNGIVRALIEEEMKIRREEMDERIRKTNQREESRGALPG